QAVGSVAAGLELACHPRRDGVRPVADDAPRQAARKTVDSVPGWAVVERQLVFLAVPGEAAVADAVGKGEQDRYAAARRPAVGEQRGVSVEQVESPAVAHRLPVEAVEAQGRPHLGPAAGAIVEDEYRRVAAGDARL